MSQQNNTRPRIPVAGPWITDREVAYVADAARNAWYENANLFNQRFERAFADYVGRRFAMSLPSCTSGLHLALAALGVGSGDEVVVPDITWIASSAPVDYVGAEPVFVDVDARTWCLDAQSFEQAITPKTRAVIIVDLYGNMPDMDAILAVAHRHGVAVIEDSAEAVGSSFGGKRAGAFGEFSVFSFHGSKTLTTGEGGMLLTDDEALYQRAQFLRDHGRPPGDRMFQNSEVAFKYKMSSMQAAMGLAQIERIDELIERKREIFSWYREALDGVPGIVLNHEEPGTVNTYWMVSAIVDAAYGLGKQELMAAFSARNIDTRPFFSPLSSLDAYAGRPATMSARQHNRVAYDLAFRGINLPSGFNLDRDTVGVVAAAFRDILDGARR